jgi:hypothetical protein
MKGEHVMRRFLLLSVMCVVCVGLAMPAMATLYQTVGEVEAVSDYNTGGVVITFKSNATVTGQACGSNGRVWFWSQYAPLNLQFSSMVAAAITATAAGDAYTMTVQQNEAGPPACSGSVPIIKNMSISP